MSIEIQQIRREAEKGLKVKLGEGITHALFRAGLGTDGEKLKRKELETAFGKLNRENRKAIIDLAKEIEQTTKLPILPESTIQLKKQIPTKEESVSPRISEMRYPPYIPRLHSDENTHNEDTDYKKEEIHYVKQLFDSIQHGAGEKALYVTDNSESILIPQNGRESYYLWDKVKGDIRNIYYLDKTGAPIGSIVIDKREDVRSIKGKINTTGLTFRPIINR